MNDIVCTKISKSFGEKPVLRDFSHTFAAGSVTCVMGPSGCGKTTLLRLLMGLEKPDSGQMRGVPERFSAVFQEDMLSPAYSALTNACAACPGDKKRAEEHLRALGLGENEKTLAGELSGGMARRVALARAMLSPGGAVLMDEPFTGMDAETRAAAIAYILREARGRTLIIVTHDDKDAGRLGAAVLELAPASK